MQMYSLAVSQHADGIFGPFIVRQSPQRDPNSHLYDYDLDEHILTLSPWSHEVSAYSLDVDENMKMSSVLINGEGSYFVSVFACMVHLLTVLTKSKCQLVNTSQCLCAK
jgi:hypothetical protein